MSNKFLLSSNSQNLANERIFAQTLGAVTLDPSQPVRTNSAKELTSGKIEVNEINGLTETLNSVITNPFPGNLDVHDLSTNYTISLNEDLRAVQHFRLESEEQDNEQTELVGSLLVSRIQNRDSEDIVVTAGANDINLLSSSGSITLNANSIELNSSNLAVNGSSIAFNLQDVYDNSTDGVTELDAGKPYVIKAVDSANLFSIDGELKEIEVIGDLIVNGINLEEELSNLEELKYDKTGGILTGDLIHNGNNVQFQGAGAFQIQNIGPVQIQPTGALILKGHGVIGEINMSNHKIVNLATPTEPFDATTKAYVDNQTVNNSSLADLQNKTQNIGSVIENEITYFTGRIQLNENTTPANSIYLSPDEHTLVIARGPGNDFELKHEDNRAVVKMAGGVELNTNLAYVTDGSGIISFDPVQNVFSVSKNPTAIFTISAEDNRTVLRSSQNIESEQNIKVVSPADSSKYVQMFSSSVLVDNGDNQLVLTPTLIRSSVANLVLDAPKVECLNDIIAPNQIGVPLCFAGSAGDGEYLIFNGVADENLNQSIPEIKHTAVCPINGVCRQITFIKGSEVGTSTFEITIGVTTHAFDITGRKGVVTIPVVDVAVSTEITIRKTANSDAGQLNMIVYVAPTSN